MSGAKFLARRYRVVGHGFRASASGRGRSLQVFDEGRQQGVVGFVPRVVVMVVVMVVMMVEVMVV